MTTSMKDAFVRAAASSKAWGKALRVDINRLLSTTNAGNYGAPRYLPGEDSEWGTLRPWRRHGKWAVHA